MGKVFMVKGPTNWWRVVAMAAVPLFLYSTYRYGEAQASLNHIMEHMRPAAHGAVHADHDQDKVPASASQKK